MRFLTTTLLRVMVIVVVSAAFGVSQNRPAKLPPAGGSEDFSTTSLAKSNLVADPPRLEEKDEESDYTREWVTVQWRPNDPIYLYVVRPKSVPKPPVVIYLYDYPSETDLFRDDDWCERTTARGYAAVGFVPALTGHRYHDRPMREWFVSELQQALGKSAHDVQMVLNYLAQRGDVDMNNVGMFGVGAGGTIAVLAASVDARIKALDLVDPWGDWPVWMAKSDVVPNNERPGFVKPEFLSKIAAFDPVALLPQLKTPHVRLRQTSGSSSVPEEARKHMEAVLPERALLRRIGGEESAAVSSGGQVPDWLKEQIGTPGNVKAGAPNGLPDRADSGTHPAAARPE